MNIVNDVLLPLSVYGKTHLAMISNVITTALLVIYGDAINRAVKNRFRNNNFLIRTIVFVLLCSVGYGLLTIWITPTVQRLLVAFGDQYLALVIVGSFMAIGVMAERRKYM